jgi:excisionase family DNA binding protein
MASRITLYTVSEAARLLSVSAWTMRDWIRKGRIEAIDIADGDRTIYRVPEVALENFIKSQRRKQ